MVDGGAPRAWLLMAAGDNRGHGGNSGYDDQIDAYYSWDSKVPNHKNLQVGDPIALWDKERLLGVSVIEEIETAPGVKTHQRCPACSMTRISERKKVAPRFRCMKCKHEFDEPVVEHVEVVEYTARYDAAWTPLDGLIDGAELRSLAVHPVDINAMRPLNWTAFRDALVAREADRAVARLSARSTEYLWRPGGDLGIRFAQGHGHSIVRVRRGQRQFREHLLASQGNVCAFTGGAPPRVLEAGHLYRYADLGTHYEHGGLMLRRDIHRLFDDGMLAVDPVNLHIDVAADLEIYPQYARLHDRSLTLNLRDEHVDWLTKHWDEHRGPSRTTGAMPG